MHQVYLGLGTNLGDRWKNMEEAIRLVGERVGMVTRRSSFHETEPWGFQSENRFLNAVILCETEKSPREVLSLTKQIERELGRTLKSKDGIYHDRLMDIDILLFDKLSIDEPDLKIPHPFMHERAFVMKPLEEIFSQC